MRPHPSGDPFTSEFFRTLPDGGDLAPLFDYLPHVYLFVKDGNHRFVRVNRAWLAMHGCESDSDAIGKTDFDFHPPALAAQYVEEDKRVIKSREALADQVWLVLGADGMPRWYLCTKLPLIGDQGKVIGLAGVMQPYDHAGDAPGDYRRLTSVCDHVLTHYPETVTVADLAKRANLSVSHLQREFQRLFGMSPTDYLLRVRLLMARRQLELSTGAVGMIAHECGFYDQSHFNRAFRTATGMSPLEYRRRFSPRAS
jgi:AraC-like DNA-binding protein